MTEEVDDHALLALHESLRWLACELEQLSKSLSGKKRREVEALCAEARQAAEILDRILRESSDRHAEPRPGEPNEK